MQAKLIFQVMALNGVRCTFGGAWTWHNVHLIKVPLVKGEELYAEEGGPSCEVRLDRPQATRMRSVGPIGRMSTCS